MREMITPKGPSPPERAPTEKYAGGARDGQTALSRVTRLRGSLGRDERGTGTLRSPCLVAPYALTVSTLVGVAGKSSGLSEISR